MATYPIKMLKDEQNQPFVPLVSTECIRDEDNQTLQQVLDKKLSPENLLGGDYVSITTQGNDCYVNVDLPSSLNIINNLTTTSAGQGALDAYQGKILKDSIPEVVNDLSSTDTTKALSANQGYILKTSIPTKISQLSNDSGFITNSSLPTKLSQLTNDSGFITSTSLPTKTSQLTNDSGFVTNSYHDNTKINTSAIKTSKSTSNSEIYSCSYINTLQTYSKTEQAIGTWIDGKTIYRKVIEYTGDSTGIALDTGITGMSWLVHAWGVARMTGNTIYLPLNFSNSGGWNSFHITGGGTTIQYQRGDNYAITKAFFILEYTK